MIEPPNQLRPQLALPLHPPLERPADADDGGAGTDVEFRRELVGVMAMVFGFLGVHKFLLGYTAAGLVMLLGSLLTCGGLALLFVPISIAEGFIYLLKTDAEFERDYLRGRRTWF
jgi:hypothetical protein